MLKKSPAGTAAMTEIKNHPSRRFGGEHSGPHDPVAAGLGTGAFGTLTEGTLGPLGASSAGGATFGGRLSTGGMMVTTVGGTTVGEEFATGGEDGKEAGLGVADGVVAVAVATAGGVVAEAVAEEGAGVGSSS
jgi:hypothetical protein